MQLLDISQSVNLDRLYVDVNILEQITSQQWRELPDLLQGFNPAVDSFNHWGLGKVHQERILGLEAVEKYSKLMVLGKPGSGKTTFLQHLAIQCNQGKFRANLVPIFIRLKAFAKYARNEGDFGLLNYISKEIRSCGISEQSFTETVLKPLKLSAAVKSITDHLEIFTMDNHLAVELIQRNFQCKPEGTALSASMRKS